MQLSLSASHGTIILTQRPGNPLMGLEVIAGANRSPSLTIRGRLPYLNKALSQLTYSPDRDYSGNDTLVLIADDLGFTGQGGAKTFTARLPIVIAPSDDGPAWALPPHPIVSGEDSLTMITGVSVDDPDPEVRDPTDLEQLAE